MTKAKEAGGSKMLEITDGTTQGSNIVPVPQDNEADKRRSNILKSRELRKRSAKGPRSNSGNGKGRAGVFDRLQKAANAQVHANVDRGNKNSTDLNIVKEPKMVSQHLAIEQEY